MEAFGRFSIIISLNGRKKKSIATVGFDVYTKLKREYIVNICTYNSLYAVQPLTLTTNVSDIIRQ